MKMLRKTICAIAGAGVLLALTGCWDNRDINHRVLPVIMGVAVAGEGYKITLQIPESVQERTQFRTISATGNTVTKAVDTISLNMESSVDLLHLKVIVVDKSLAKRGVKDMISGFMRARDVSPKTLIVLCEEELDSFFEHVSSQKKPVGTMVLYDFFEKNAGWNPQIALTHTWEVYRSIHSYTKDVAIPIIKSGSQTMVEHRGSAILKNGKMVGQISPEETLLFNAFIGQSSQGKIEDMNHASVLIVGDSLKNKIGLANGKPVMNSRLKLRVVVSESKENPTPAMIRQELEQLLTSRFNHMFKLLQTSGADILGLGQSYRMKLTRDQLRNWRSDYYPKLQLDFQLVIDIRNEGYLRSLSD